MKTLPAWKADVERKISAYIADALFRITMDSQANRQGETKVAAVTNLWQGMQET